MKSQLIRNILILAFLCTVGRTSAAPSAVGHYGGFTPGRQTLTAFDSTARGIIRNLEIVGLEALCITTIPGMGAQPAVQRSTNITRRETPQFRLRANGTFAGTFVLDDPGRLDFQNARVRVSGRLSGRRGSVTYVLNMNETYGDGSSMVCGGTVRIPVRLAARR